METQTNYWNNIGVGYIPCKVKAGASAVTKKSSRHSRYKSLLLELVSAELDPRKYFYHLTYQFL